MSLTPNQNGSAPRWMMLLAPTSAGTAFNFGRPRVDALRHEVLLAETQRLRGRVYLEDGAVESWQLSGDGKHVQQVDSESWHLLLANGQGRVSGCVRYSPYKSSISFSDLGVAHSALAQSDVAGRHLQLAVEAELAYAQERGIDFSEVGGWALSAELRCTSEALRLALTIYALGQLLGGAVGISTATTRHNSSSILRRIGGHSLVNGSAELPPYYDPQYKCEMEVLRFDSSHPNRRYQGWVEECRAELSAMPVIYSQEAPANWMVSASNLEIALNRASLLTQENVPEVS